MKRIVPFVFPLLLSGCAVLPAVALVAGTASTWIEETPSNSQSSPIPDSPEIAKYKTTLVKPFLGATVKNDYVTDELLVELLDGGRLFKHHDDSKNIYYLIDECAVGVTVNKSTMKITAPYVIERAYGFSKCTSYYSNLEHYLKYNETPKQHKARLQKEAKIKKQQELLAKQKRQEERKRLADTNWKAARLLLGSPKAFPYLEEAAKNGHAEAMYHLSEAYMSGIGVEKNHRIGVNLLEKSATLGSAKAQYALGMYYKSLAEQDVNVPHTMPMAYAWLYLANKKGINMAEKPMKDIRALLTVPTLGLPEGDLFEEMWADAQRLTKTLEVRKR